MGVMGVFKKKTKEQRLEELEKKRKKEEVNIEDYNALENKWWPCIRQNTLFLMEVTKVIFILISTIFFTIYFWGPFPARTKVINEMNIDELWVRKWSQYMELTLLIWYTATMLICLSVAAASMIQCLYMPPPNWHIIDDIALNKDRGKAKEDFVSNENKKNTVENRSFQIWREFVEGRNKYRPAFLGAKLSADSSEEEAVEFFFKWLDQRKLIKTYHWVAFYMDFLCGIFTILMCYDFNIPAYGRTAYIRGNGVVDFRFGQKSHGIEHLVVCFHAGAMGIQMMLALYHIEPEMAKIIPDFYFAEKHRLLYPVNTGPGLFAKIKNAIVKKCKCCGKNPPEKEAEAGVQELKPKKKKGLCKLCQDEEPDIETPETPQKNGKNGLVNGKAQNEYTSEPEANRGNVPDDGADVYAEYCTSDEKRNKDIADEVMTSSRPVSRASRKSRLSLRSRTSNKVVPENNQTLPGAN